MIKATDKRALLFCALDHGIHEKVYKTAESIAEFVDGLKLGLEYFTALGPRGVEQFSELGLPIFLDLKLHDIPNTIMGAVRSLVPLSPYYLTLHASGGEQMLYAASQTAHEEASKLSLPTPKLLAVTILTSLDSTDLLRQGISRQVTDQTLRLAELSQQAGMDGIVCSPHEIKSIRNNCGNHFDIVVPGIRQTSDSTHDQKRVMAPSQAVEAGADVLVVGRPITSAPNPVSVAKDIVAQLGACTKN